MTADHRADQNGVKWTIGRAARWLRDRWVLTMITLLAAIALAVLPLLRLDTEGGLTRPTALILFSVGIVAAIAAAGDRVADWHVKREAELEEEVGRSAVNNILTALLGLLKNTHDAPFEEGAARTAKLDTLRSQLAQSAAIAPVASNIRASCYRLTRDTDGWRELRDPRNHGRTDEGRTKFVERDDPDHPIWTLMSAQDSNCVIYKAPDTRPQVDWPNKPYQTFVSVPIHADGVVFGMLSVNAPQVGDLTEVDRLTVIAMARVMATTLAVNKGPRNLRAERDESGTMDAEQGGADA